MDIRDEILSLGLPEGSYVVVGGGILGALGIRESNDIDMIVSREVFAQLDNAGWEHDKWEDQIVLKKGIFDIGTEWANKNVDVLLDEATVIEDIPYLGLSDLLAWKRERARPKDLIDVKLITDYLAQINKVKF